MCAEGVITKSTDIVLVTENVASGRKELISSIQKTNGILRVRKKKVFFHLNRTEKVS